MNEATTKLSPKPKPQKKLNLRQKLFCDWYIKLGGSRCATQAAIKAGYSEKAAAEIASRLLTYAKIQEYLEYRRHHLEDLLGFNKSTILEDLHAIKARSMQAEPVMYYSPKEKAYVQKTEMNEKGEEVGVYQFDSNGANRAIENINKMMGYNEPEKVEDVTPLENKPSAVIINKTYVNKEPDKPTS